jgi:A/G-specific adenine glycosylase
MGEFASRLVAWQRRHGRHDLPWQRVRDPYAIWVAEIMLQQTQVATVIPYYMRFMMRFPGVVSLAHAPLDDVLALWSGLGYYSRARNLHRSARAVVEDHGGAFPRGAAALEALPGIGRSTAAAIAAFAWGERRAVLDGNVKRVLARCFGIEGFPGDREPEDALWKLADSLLPRRGIETYTQGLMDLGAMVCTRARPRCDACPMQESCVALREGRVKELPSPRPRMRIPKRETMMLLLVRRGEVLLEKRPPAGVWGGLWCLPEASLEDDLTELCRRRYGARLADSVALPALEHGFTHFRLRIHPQLVRVASVEHAARSPAAIWVNAEDALAAAIPVPVRTLIRSHLVPGTEGA